MVPDGQWKMEQTELDTKKSLFHMMGSSARKTNSLKYSQYHEHMLIGLLV